MSFVEQTNKDFKVFYLNQLHSHISLPESITSQFEILECLCSKDTKEIFLLQEKNSDKKFILRQLPKNRSQQNVMEKDILNSLHHDSIPKFFALLEDKQYSYLIREYFDGMSLEAYVMQNHPLTDQVIQKIAVQVCDLLIYLHEHEPPIIHRDIKPQNIIVQSDGTIKLIDFDSSRLYDRNAAYDTEYIGTKQTAAPEQFGYGQTDQHTDIYALGVLLIFLSTKSYDRAEIVSMSPSLRRIAAKCTEFSPKDRYDNADKVKRNLLRCSNRFLRSVVVFTILLLILGSVTGYIFLQKPYSASSDPVDQPVPEVTTGSDSEQPNIEAVTFESPEIELAVRRTLGKSNDEPLYQEELSQITALSIVADSSEEISRGDIQHDYNSRIIRVADKQVARGAILTLRDLSKLTSLSDLTILYQQLDDLSGIENLHLTSLYVGYNQIKDLTPISNMTSLTALSIICNPIEDAAPLKNLSKLRYLQICGTDIRDLSPLTSMSSLTDLDVFAMTGLDLTPLKDMKNLNIIK